MSSDCGECYDKGSLATTATPMKPVALRLTGRLACGHGDTGLRANLGRGTALRSPALSRNTSLGRGTNLRCRADGLADGRCGNCTGRGTTGRIGFAVMAVENPCGRGRREHSKQTQDTHCHNQSLHVRLLQKREQKPQSDVLPFRSDSSTNESRTNMTISP